MKLKFKKGLTLNIAGPVDASAKPLDVDVASVAVCPDDYPGFIPKVAVKDGEAVAVGSPLLFDKKHPETKIVSPVTGSVKAIVRGERRKILRVEVDAGTEACVQPHFDKPSDKASAKRFLAESGLLALMRQRPYDIVPSPEDTVRDIFVTAIDSAPLAFPLCDAGDFLFEKEDYDAGIAVLNIVSEGKVYFCHDMSWTLGALSGAETIEVEGRHPAGNVSVQIAAIKPVDKGDVVWTLDVLTLGRIGRTLRTGVFAAETVVAVTGPEVSEPCLLGAVIGARVAPLLAGRVADNGHSVRVVSGNLLTGTANRCIQRLSPLSLSPDYCNSRWRRCGRVYGLGFVISIEDEREPFVPGTLPETSFCSRRTPPRRSSRHDYERPVREHSAYGYPSGISHKGYTFAQYRRNGEARYIRGCTRGFCCGRICRYIETAFAADSARRA